jgi:tRNA G18 (ribose-2'-O)-methylase SpoU
MGAIEVTDWRYYKTTAEAVKHYRSRGYSIIGIETVEKAINLYEAEWPVKSAFVFGNEEFGMMEENLALCDSFIEIPMAGVKNSLNVASSFAVVMAEAMRRLLL